MYKDVKIVWYILTGTVFELQMGKFFALTSKSISHVLNDWILNQQYMLQYNLRHPPHLCEHVFR